MSGEGGCPLGPESKFEKFCELLNNVINLRAWIWFKVSSQKPISAHSVAAFEQNAYETTLFSDFVLTLIQYFLLKKLLSCVLIMIMSF